MRSSTTAIATLTFFVGLSPSQAQEPLPRFDVKETRVDPTEAAPALEDPMRAIKRPLSLSLPPRDSALEATARRIAPAIVTVLAVKTPPRPFQQIPTVTRGHGVFISGDEGEPPVLISTLDWLEGAEAIYLAPPVIREVYDNRAGLILPTQTTARDVTVGAIDADFLEENRAQLTPLKLTRPDRSRNLTQLTGERVIPPAKGLALYDLSKPIAHTYSYTQLVKPERLAVVNIAPTRPAEEGVQFYFQVSACASLGAPILSASGELLMLTVMRHPQDPKLTLTIPPGALRHYLKQATSAAP